jgi:neutral ceramidase
MSGGIARVRGFFAVLGIVLSAVACAPARMPGAARAPNTPAPAVAQPLLVGAASVDITPPPGPATFGHGPDSFASQGYWTRLGCRAFVFESEGAGNRHALVSCELGAISHLLQRETALRLKNEVHVSRLMLTATHTHAGPAHFFENPAYSGTLSSRNPGFDPKMVDFLADRIASGVKAAVAALRPARLRWLSGPVWELSRNRSPLPFQANSPRFQSQWSAPAGITPAEREVDPRLEVLEIEEAAGAHAPIGVVAFFAMHPTVLPAHTRFFGGDTHGVATRLLDRDLLRVARTRGGSHAPVSAIVNTNEGDISPVWFEGTAAEAVRLGTRLAGEIQKLTQLKLPAFPDTAAPVPLDSRYLEVELAGGEYTRGRLCSRALLGQASGRGASDHRSTTDGLVDESSDYAEEPTCDPVLECQRPKAPLLGPIQPVLISTEGFPSRVPLALQRLGDRLLAFVPAELTITAGQRVARAVERSYGHGLGERTLVVGLSNAFIQYVTTPEEYELQQYEGASNLYGSQTLDFLSEKFGWLAVSLRGGDTPAWMKFGEAGRFEYKRATERPRLPDPEAGASLEALGGERRARFACRVDAFEPPAVCFAWADGAPGRVGLTKSPWLRLLRASGEPLPSCWQPLGEGQPAVCDADVPLDDRGFDFFTWSEGAAGKLWNWSTLFRPTPLQAAALKGAGRLQIRAGDISSGSFTFDDLQRCSGSVLRRCMRGAL